MGANADDTSPKWEIRTYKTSSVMRKIKLNAFNLGQLELSLRLPRDDESSVARGPFDLSGW